MMEKKARRKWLGYLVALGSSALALWLAVTLEHPWVALSPFFLFYGAVAISSWFGGTGPGLVATAIGALAADYYLIHPARSFRIEDPQAVPRLVLFTSVGVLIASLNGALRRSQVRCELEADAARRSEARAKRLAEANLIGVFFSDLDGKIRWANRELLRLLGKSAADFENGPVNWRDMTAPEHRDRDERAIQELRGCRVCTPFEKDHILAQDRRIPVLVGCAIVGDNPNDVVGFVLDLTERKKAEAEAKQNQQRLQEVAAEMMMVEERERRRIATVLHDSVVQMLALAKMKIDGLRRTSSGDGKDRLDHVYESIDQAIAQTRTLTAELSPPVLYELGLAAAIQWLGDRMRGEHGISFQLDGGTYRRAICDETRIVLFQAVRELLVNVVKHARASKCRVAVSQDEQTGELTLVVEDNGVGFDLAEPRDYTKGGFGLFNIRQRLAHLGGSIAIANRAGGGSAVTVKAPSGLPRKQSEKGTEA